MQDAILRLHGLTKTYGSKTAVKDVRFTVEKGHIYGFIGENGAGKTTTIRAITGLSPAPEGAVELFGTTAPKALEAARKRMGCLVERPILALGKTALANLRMQQTLLGLRDEARARQLLERVGLSDVGNKKVKDFSLGMKQRLGIALALVNEPELLILDEPVNGLDPMGMVAVRELLRSLCLEDGITILVSSHILSELYQLVTDYIIISGGRIVETLSRQALDERCTACIRIETPEAARAQQVLAENGIRQLQAEGQTLRVYDPVPIEAVAGHLFEARILVTGLEKHENSLEEYYMKLLGRAER